MQANAQEREGKERNGGNKYLKRSNQPPNSTNSLTLTPRHQDFLIPTSFPSFRPRPQLIPPASICTRSQRKDHISRVIMSHGNQH
ncbi:uncharacterized protein LAJ45_02869 [Morchella importuna]|uniref:uncharacterized protein n=1 Tax=Morchella importuna TaxID=1174673 RepID=UPI001E8CB8D6|nr:uncharacterized protein LAJ45_02869 [Morchella importuna]KAH8153282.1 hypothetical protein LAJ45_02869 [Morchella importuna]